MSNSEIFNRANKKVFAAYDFLKKLQTTITPINKSKGTILIDEAVDSEMELNREIQHAGYKPGYGFSIDVWKKYYRELIKAHVRESSIGALLTLLRERLSFFVPGRPMYDPEPKVVIKIDSAEEAFNIYVNKLLLTGLDLQLLDATSIKIPENIDRKFLNEIFKDIKVSTVMTGRRPSFKYSDYKAIQSLRAFLGESNKPFGEFIGQLFVIMFSGEKQQAGVDAGGLSNIFNSDLCQEFKREFTEPVLGEHILDKQCTRERFSKENNKFQTKIKKLNNMSKKGNSKTKYRSLAKNNTEHSSKLVRNATLKKDKFLAELAKLKSKKANLNGTQKQIQTITNKIKSMNSILSRHTHENMSGYKHLDGALDLRERILPKEQIQKLKHEEVKIKDIISELNEKIQVMEHEISTAVDSGLANDNEEVIYMYDDLAGLQANKLWKETDLSRLKSILQTYTEQLDILQDKIKQSTENADKYKKLYVSHLAVTTNNKDKYTTRKPTVLTDYKYSEYKEYKLSDVVRRIVVQKDSDIRVVAAILARHILYSGRTSDDAIVQFGTCKLPSIYMFILASLCATPDPTYNTVYNLVDAGIKNEPETKLQLALLYHRCNQLDLIPEASSDGVCEYLASDPDAVDDYIELFEGRFFDNQKNKTRVLAVLQSVADVSKNMMDSKKNPLGALALLNLFTPDMEITGEGLINSISIGGISMLAHINKLKTELTEHPEDEINKHFLFCCEKLLDFFSEISSEDRRKFVVHVTGLIVLPPVITIRRDDTMDQLQFPHTCHKVLDMNFIQLYNQLTTEHYDSSEPPKPVHWIDMLKLELCDIDTMNTY